MSLARFFSKPRWQSKDDAVRRAAVATDDDTELRAALPRLAKEDPDAGVRIAALKRLADPGLTQALAHDDRDDGVRAVARALWTELLTGTHASSPTLVERVRLLRAQDEPRLIEHIAVRAPEAELRLAALSRVTRPALIAERATADVDAVVRAAALERIDDEAQLARIADRARKSDKKTSRQASERLDALRLARGDAGAIGERARVLCERLEAVLRGGASEDVTTIDAQWKQIAAHAQPGLVTRYAAAHALYELSRDPARIAELRERTLERERIVVELATLERDVAGADALSEREQLIERFDLLAERFATSSASEMRATSPADAQRVRAIAQRLAQLESDHAAVAVHEDPLADPERAAARARRDDELAAVAAERQHKDQHRRAGIVELSAALDAAEQAVDSGNTASVHAAWPGIVDLRKRVGEIMPAALRRRLIDIESHYSRLSEWQRWSDNHRRRQLCEEIEALPAALLHPDAVATRVREAQAEWTRLDAIEGRATPSVDSLSRRFRTLCRQAIEPTRPYFDKRDELRRAHAQQIAGLIARANEPLAESPNTGDIAKLRRETADALRSLDSVDPRERKLLAQKLKDALGNLDRRVDAQYAAIESIKSALIADAGALSAQADVRSAMSAARELQKRWQTSGNGKRSRDEAQWRAFRKAVDAVFARADDERTARSTREREVLDQATALCSELEELAQGDNDGNRAEIARIDSAWNALGIGDPGLRRRHQDAHASLRDAQARRQSEQRRGRFDVWLAHYQIVRRAERGELDGSSMSDALTSLATLTIADSAMRQRQNLLSEETMSAFEDTSVHRDCLLEMEQLAGIESPAQDRQRRLDLQVAKLSARMRGDLARSPTEQLDALLARWTEAGALPHSAGEYDNRFQRALQRVLGDLG